MHWSALEPSEARRIHTRGMARHFSSRAVWAAFRHHAAAPRVVPPALSGRLVKAVDADVEPLLTSLKTQAEGLTGAQAAEIPRRVGQNKVDRHTQIPRWRHLRHCYRNPFNLLLTALAVVMAGVFLPTGPLAHYVRFEPLPIAFFGYLAAVLLGYVILTQAMKTFYARRYGWQ